MNHSESLEKQLARILRSKFKGEWVPIEDAFELGIFPPPPSTIGITTQRVFTWALSLSIIAVCFLFSVTGGLIVGGVLWWFTSDITVRECEEDKWFNKCGDVFDRFSLKEYGWTAEEKAEWEAEVNKNLFLDRLTRRQKELNALLDERCNQKKQRTPEEAAKWHWKNTSKALAA